MKKNVNRIDQAIRFVVAAVCLYYGFIDNSLIQDDFLAFAVGVFGVLNLMPAIMRFCPFYHLANISTEPHKPA